MDVMNLIFCILSIVAGILTLIGGIIYMTEWSAFFLYVLGIYLIIFALYIIVVEIFMPKKLRGLMAFYLTWAGKAVFFVFIGVLLLIPWELNFSLRVYFLVSAIYMFVVAVIYIALQVLSCVGKVSKRAHPIVGGSDDDEAK